MLHTIQKVERYIGLHRFNFRLQWVDVFKEPLLALNKVRIFGQDACIYKLAECEKGFSSFNVL